MTIRPTYQLAHAAGMDAGNRSMRAAGRTAWNEEDAEVAAATLNRLWSPEENEHEEA